MNECLTGRRLAGLLYAKKKRKVGNEVLSRAMHVICCFFFFVQKSLHSWPDFLKYLTILKL